MMHAKYFSTCLLAFTTLVFSARSGAAQSTSAERQASSRLKEGLALAKSGHWDEARLQFQQAYSVLPSSDLLWNLALAELNSDRPFEALGHFREYRADGRADPGKKEMSARLIDRAAARVGHLRFEVPRGAGILVDGALPAKTSWDGDVLDVPAGEHLVRADLQGRRDERRVIAGAGAVITVSLLSPQLAASEPVNAASGIDPMSSPGVAARPAGNDAASNRRSSAPLIAGGIAGGVGVGLGVMFVILANNKASEARDYQKTIDSASTSGAPACPGATPELAAACSSLSSANHAKAQFSNWAVGTFVAGGLAAGTGLALYALLPPTGASAHGVRAVPLVGSGATGISVSGTW